MIRVATVLAVTSYRPWKRDLTEPVRGPKELNAAVQTCIGVKIAVAHYLRISFF